MTTITIKTNVSNPRPTETGVTGGVDYDAELAVTDEAGEIRRWSGELTYAPDHDGNLVPFGDTLDMWMEDSLIRATREPYIAAHPRLVEAVVESLGGGPGAETIEVTI